MGGDESYAFAEGDPVNNSDPLGTCVFDTALLPTVVAEPHATYWQLCYKGHNAGYIKWVSKSSVKWRSRSQAHGPSVCKALQVGGSAMAVYYGGAGIVTSPAGPEVSGPLFLMSGGSELVGEAFGLAHDLTGC